MNKWMIALSVGLAFSAFAHAGREFKGGDPVAIEFQSSAAVAIQEVESDIQDFPQIRDKSPETILAHAKILVSDTPLYIESNGVRQESAAINAHSPDRIILNRSSWNSIESQEVKNALALHEVLSLAGIEDTGSYPVSANYLSFRGLSCSPDHCSALTFNIGSFTFEKARALFDEAGAPSRSQLDGAFWLMLGLAEMPTASFSAPPEYAENGVLNSDDESRIILSFRNYKSDLGESNFGLYYMRISDSQPAIQNAGPQDTYPIALNSSGVSFSMPGTVKPVASDPAKTGDFKYECRLVHPDAQIMICGGAFSNPYHGVVSGQVVRYLLLKNDPFYAGPFHEDYR
jgi:hypothetical protein